MAIYRIIVCLSRETRKKGRDGCNVGGAVQKGNLSA